MKAAPMWKMAPGFAVVIIFLLLFSSGRSPVACAQAGPADPDDHSPKVIHFVEQVQNVTFVEVPPAGPSQGDRVVFTSNLFDEDGAQIGTDGADCLIVRIDPSAPPATQQIVQCTITVQLADGQITFQGMARGTQNFFAITGGTGAYNKARGEAFASDRVPLQTADVTITVFR